MAQAQRGVFFSHNKKLFAGDVSEAKHYCDTIVEADVIVIIRPSPRGWTMATLTLAIGYIKKNLMLIQDYVY